MDIESFIIHVKTEGFYKYIADDVDKWFDTSRYSKADNRPLTIGINKTIIGMFKDDVDGGAMTENAHAKAKEYAFLWENGGKECEKKKAKGTKKCVTEKDLTFDDFKNLVLKNETIIRSQQRFKS